MSSFMVPDIQFFSTTEANEYAGCGIPNCACCASEFPEGWYARLSAPGYLDCSDWHGPFKTEAEALDELVEQYDLCVECKENGTDGSELCDDCNEEKE